MHLVALWVVWSLALALLAALVTFAALLWRETRRIRRPLYIVIDRLERLLEASQPAQTETAEVSMYKPEGQG